MKPDGTLTVDEIMQYVDMLQWFEKEELAKRLGYGYTEEDDEYDDPLQRIDDEYDAVNHFGENSLLNAMDDDVIVEYMEDRGFKLIEKD